jgi:hypothetical protein
VQWFFSHISTMISNQIDVIPVCENVIFSRLVDVLAKGENLPVNRMLSG